MTFLLTLLTFFLDGKPNVPEPAPATSGAITVPGELDAPVSNDLPYHEIGAETSGLPRLTPATLSALPSVGDDCQRGSFCGSTPPTYFTSPSMMVAHPPASARTFDVFSPTARAPQELPGLFPCEPVALVPCPSPEPPAVRHVSFLDDVLPQPVPVNPYCDPLETDSKCTPNSSVLGKPASLHCDNAPAHTHKHSYPPNPYAHPPIHPPVPFGHMPVAFASPFGGPLCPAEPSPFPPGMNTTPFPGAKKVQHVVWATYDVPHETAQALKPILEQSQGVFECSVEGDELTIHAFGPAQTAIAQFLVTVVNQPRMISKPTKAVDVKCTTPRCGTTELNGKKYQIRVKEVKLNKSACCNGECECKDKCQCCGNKKPAKAIDVKYTKPKCCNDTCKCKDKCQCCGNKKPAQAEKSTAETDQWFKKYFLSEKARKIEQSLGLDSSSECPSKCPVTIDCPVVKEVKDTHGNVFSFYVGVDRSETASKTTQCSGTSQCKETAPCTQACEPQTTVQWKSSTQSQPVRVVIHATPDGVSVKTSDGTQLRAQQIQLETEGIHKLEVRNGDAVFTMPKPQEAKSFHGTGQEYRLTRPYVTPTKPVRKAGKPANPLPRY